MESITGNAIGFFSMSTFRAFSARIPWIYNFDFHSGKDRFIRNELTELEEPPGRMLRTLRLFNRYSFPNAGKFFQGNSVSECLGLRNNLLGDTVVLVPGEPGFFTFAFLKQSSSRSRTFLLEFVTQAPVPGAKTIYFVATVGFPHGIYGDILYAEVHAKPLGRFSFRWFRKFYNEKQIEYLINQDQVCLPMYAISGENALMIIADDKRYLDTARKRKQGRNLQAVEGKNSFVVDHSPHISKSMQIFFGNLVTFRDFANGAYNHLRRKTKLLSDFIITKLLEFDFSETARIKSNSADVVAGLVKAEHRFQQLLMLVLIGKQFDFNGAKHNSYAPLKPTYNNILRNAINKFAIPPPIKVRGFLAEAL